ncbi:MAG: cytidine deaminase [Tatlockia sp.]|jgi:cytidine deaminase
MQELVGLMISKAKKALPFAYAPYSNYQVACCICAEGDKLFTGVNVENASYGLTTCAEASAICQMVSAGLQKIKSIVVLNGENTFCSPCGACRQKLFEFSTGETLVHLCDQNNVLKTLKIDDLLPLAFRLEIK